MKLFYIVPINLDQLRPWLITELVLLVFSVVSILLGIVFARMIRIHINLKVLMITGMVFCWPGQLSRLAIIGYQLDMFPVIIRDNCTNLKSCTVPGESLPLIACSWIRGWFISLTGTGMLWFSLERVFALHYLRDYEQHRRLWISVLIVLLSMTFCTLTSTAYTFEIQWIPWTALVAIGLGAILLGCGLFFVEYSRAKHIMQQSEEEQTLGKTPLHLESSLPSWGEPVLIRNGYITVVAFDIYTLIAFVLATSPLSEQYLGEATTQFLDCVYNLLIQLNAPILILGGVTSNSYLVSMVKRMFCLKSKVEAVSEGELYFEHLRQQWDALTPGELERQKNVVKRWKIFTLTILVQFFPFLIGRVVIIGYETNLFKWFFPLKGCQETNNKEVSIQETWCIHPENNWIVIVASWYRCHYLALILTSLFWYGVERTWATHFIRDYEKKPRIWISILHSIQATSISMFCAFLYTFELFPWYPMAGAGVLSAVLGFSLWFYGYKKSHQILDDFNRISHSGNLQYTLSLRFQLEENLWCAKQMRNAYLALSFCSLYAFMAFILATSGLSEEMFGEGSSEYFDCFYNIIFAANGPILLLCAVARNSYFLGIIKRLLCGRKKVVEQTIDEGQVYFVKLRQQWEMPDEKLSQKGRRGWRLWKRKR